MLPAIELYRGKGSAPTQPVVVLTASAVLSVMQDINSCTWLVASEFKVMKKEKKKEEKTPK